MSDVIPMQIYTDGACSPNPGPGGYGAIIVCGDSKTELSGGFRNTTNNRMEIFAALAALRAIAGRGTDLVTIYSDSRYLVDMYNGGYAMKWRASGWRLASRKKALNADLWGELLEITASRPVAFVWVRGHNEHPENERCDELAVAARQQEDLPPDAGYEALAAEPKAEQLDLFASL